MRPLALPAEVPGALFLSAMPGRFGPLADFTAAMAAAGVAGILCLAERDEIERKSPEYAAALAAGALVADAYPLADFGVPADARGFADWVRGVARRLRGGERLVLHCAAGIGRTGTVATCLLRELGVPLEAAAARVEAAGSHPETEAQRGFVAAYATVRA